MQKPGAEGGAARSDRSESAAAIRVDEFGELTSRRGNLPD